MLYKKTISVVAGAAFAAYQAGEHLRYDQPTAKALLTIATAATTSSATVTVNFTTFAQIEPPPPVVPPDQRFEQS